MNSNNLTPVSPNALERFAPDPRRTTWDPCRRVIHYPPLHNTAESSTGQAASPSSPSEGVTAGAGGEIHRSVQLSCGEHTDYGEPLSRQALGLYAEALDP